MSGFLDAPLTSFALCWRVERRDGVALGFTAHDRDLLIDGFRYRASPGIAPSAIEDGDPLDADTLEIAGALTADAISEGDLRAGRWNGAAVRVLAADWSDPRRNVRLVAGELGAVSLERGRFSAELRGPGALLDRPVVEETTPLCRAELGDRRCRVDMAGRAEVARILAAEDALLTLDRSEPGPNGWGGGSVRWLDGANGGLSASVLTSSGASVTLSEPPPFLVAAGERVEVREGCDKRFETCRARFSNAANFRGEPHLPGIDLLTRYPGE
ncbi:DUF2163 domain-containing protein [Sphingomonas sp. MAH-20]|uniref:DUF2163 domain-containing protein n=1 Tax=Sphingomonas horti TaxID=2682842 RepID=A0A6I4J065_9SPHN|nr:MULTISPECIES: DUF2163 domain-containing protein [Sphingomonas]MBA2920049.1 DUF2163 domain-containing protein [Sphingomonas sp. CGMCC 1.13658]MVO77929.1 DUF2163 domain-containing protein [Sphingomonas horti]